MEINFPGSKFTSPFTYIFQMKMEKFGESFVAFTTGRINDLGLALGGRRQPSTPRYTVIWCSQGKGMTDPSRLGGPLLEL